MGILTNSQGQVNEIKDLLSKKTPSYRKAYSDRTSWLMACMSKLAYLRFNPPIKNPNFEETILKLIDDKSHSSKVLGYINNHTHDYDKEKETLEKELSGLLKYKLVETFDVDDTQAILVKNDEFVVLAFRGTETDSLKDIKSDLAIQAKIDGKGKVHSGFMEAYSKVEAEIETALNLPDTQDKPLFITGHSLGGALATIAAKKIKHAGGNAACYTFGSPKVGNEEWLKDIKTPIYRVVNAVDCVTMLPPSTLINIFKKIFKCIPYIKSLNMLENIPGYMHCGHEMYLTNRVKPSDEVNLLRSVTSLYRLKTLWRTMASQSYKKPLEDHAIEAYREKLYVIAKRKNQAVPPIRD